MRTLWGCLRWGFALVVRSCHLRCPVLHGVDRRVSPRSASCCWWGSWAAWCSSRLLKSLVPSSDPCLVRGVVVASVRRRIHSVVESGWQFRVRSHMQGTLRSRLVWSGGGMLVEGHVLCAAGQVCSPVICWAWQWSSWNLRLVLWGRSWLLFRISTISWLPSRIPLTTYDSPSTSQSSIKFLLVIPVLSKLGNCLPSDLLQPQWHFFFIFTGLQFSVSYVVQSRIFHIQFKRILPFHQRSPPLEEGQVEDPW